MNNETIDVVERVEEASIPIKSEDDEFKYIARSIYSEKFLLKYAWASTLRFPIILIHVFAMLTFIGIGIYYILSGNMTYMAIVLPVFGVILIPSMILLANISMAKTMKKAYAKYGMTGDFSVDFFFADNVIMRNSSTKMVSFFDYKDMKKMYSSLGLIIIETFKGYRIILDGKSFLKGNKEEFISELSNKIKENVATTK